MNTANLGLCRELYELSGWDGTEHHLSDGYDDYEIQAAEEGGFKDCPLYELGYLLQKLPLEVRDFPIQLRPNHLRNLWLCGYKVSQLDFQADIPEDALCKLAIELFKQGILTREERR